jgi:hypothetical protein
MASWLPAETQRSTLPEGAVLAADAAGEVDGEPKRMLRHGLRIHGRADRHVDAARERRLVVDVLEEVALHVEDAAQVRGALETLSRHVGLSDDGEDLGQAGLDGLIRRVGLAIDDRVALVEPCSASGLKMRSMRCGDGRRRTSGLSLVAWSPMVRA